MIKRDVDPVIDISLKDVCTVDGVLIPRRQVWAAKAAFATVCTAKVMVTSRVTAH